MDRQDKPFQIDERELAEKLTHTPGLDLGQNGHLVRRLNDENRDDRNCRIHFEWVCADAIRYNLVAGPDVVADFARTRAFHHAYPDLGIRPVALIQTSDGGIAVLEHFAGRSLEQALASGTLSLDDAQGVLDRLMDQLEVQSVPVGLNVFREEMEALREEIHTCPIWGSVDLHFLDAIVFPFLKTTCEPNYLRQRWTTGDFIARNILVGANGDLRLIDCEFANKTALASADFQRFSEFSNVPIELREHVRARLPGDPRWWRIHFALDQACKLGRVRQPDTFALHAGALLQRIWRDIHDSPAAPPTSRLFDFLGDFERLAQHAHDLQARYNELLAHANTMQVRYDELLAHSNSLQTRYDEIATHSKELQSRYAELLAHSNTLQGHYDALAQHTSDLQAAYDSQATRAADAESARADLAQRLARLKRPWRWFMRS